MTDANDTAGHRDEVLVIERDPGLKDEASRRLQRCGLSVTVASRGDEGIELTVSRDFDVVLINLDLPDMSGLAVCESIRILRPRMPIVAVAERASVARILSAMRAGAVDFVDWTTEAASLSDVVRRVADRHKLERDVQRLRGIERDCLADSIVGESEPMRKVRELIARVAPSDASVLITGESGTGKELVAREVHASSHRRDGPFVALSCAAVPASLIESELFGHVRGAFTGAHVSRAGLLALANRGTLFLDEVGELSLEMQPKLLRALQQRSVRPVGGTNEVAFDARIVASTNRDLVLEVSKSLFRQDLYYRLNVVRIDVPPLRQRGRDILLLAQHFIRSFAEARGKAVQGMAAPVAARFMSYPWPGNVRELGNCIERGVTLTLFDHIVVDDLPDALQAYAGAEVASKAEGLDELVSLAELERSYIRRVLSLVEGNKSRAAQILGVDRRTLYRKLERYENSGGGW